MFLGYFSTGRFQDHGSSMVQVGSLTYFVPDMADAVGVFEAATREYTQVDTWRNNPNTTMDLPWIFHGSSMDLPGPYPTMTHPWTHWTVYKGWMIGLAYHWASQFAT